MSVNTDLDQKVSKADTAVGITAEASSVAIEKTATITIELMNKLTEVVPWLELWYARIGMVIIIAILLFMSKQLFLNGLSKIADKFNVHFDSRVQKSLHRPISLLIFVLCFEICVLILEEEFKLPLYEQLGIVSSALLVIAVAMFLTGMVTNMETGLAIRRKRKGIDYSRSGLKAIAKLIRLVVWIIAIMVILGVFGVSITGLLAFGGVGGMIAGLAARDMLANFFGAIMVYMDRPFRVGDWVRSPDREIEGTVEDIGWRVTRIRTFDKRPLYVPNATFTTIAIENPSRMLNRRIFETIGVRYDDLDTVDEIVKETRKMLRNHDDIDANNTLIVNLNTFSASSVDIMVYAFTNTTEWVKYHDVKQNVLLKVEKIIRAQGAQIAFPTTTMRIKREVNQSKDSPLERKS